MIGIVWGKTKERAIEELEKIKKNYIHRKTDIIKKGKDYFEAQNGDVWRAVKADEYVRGYKCNISYIDKSIPQDIVRTNVIYSTMLYPYQAFKYFDI